MKAVLVSIQPKWCTKIASREKLVEIRKTMPKLETPFKVYIYETLGKHIGRTKHHEGIGKVIGEFVCDEIFPIRVFDNGTIQGWNRYDIKDSCVPYDEIVEYIGNNRTGYGWHISNLKIYDSPKDICKFHNDSVCWLKGCDIPYLYEPPCAICGKSRLTRPPQSWCYVTSVE